jgi:hypothetical protein
MAMNTIKRKCPKCSGEMEKGILGTGGCSQELNWGKNSIKYRVNNLQVDTLVCLDCGFIENYVPATVLARLPEPVPCAICTGEIVRELELKRCNCGKCYHIRCVIKEAQCRNCGKIW